jgi:choline dehydrogenase-like flavoprotein
LTHAAVIGSGVSGIFAAHALIRRGLAVTILDVGEVLDARRSSVVAKLRDIEPENWPQEDDALIRRNETLEGEELPKKMHFGSDYIYARDRSFARVTTRTNTRAPYPTFAKGGFSNIWGAAVLPTDACDMRDWPVSRAEMEPYFREVAALIPLCGGSGTLSSAFPSYKDHLGELDPGPQGSALLADLARAGPKLCATETLYGKARVAIHVAPEGLALPCSGCGQCFTGCVRGSIYSTVPMLEAMVRDGRIAYRSGLFVETVDEVGGSVAVTAIDLQSSARLCLAFDAIFIAGGPINSTRLLLRSKRLYDLTVRMKESQKFAFPALRFQGAATGITHPAVTLASVFLETKTPTLSDHWLHTQMISMNEMIAAGSGLPAVRGQIGAKPWSPLLRHTMMAWCGMHSDHSSEVGLRLRRDTTADEDVLELDLRVSDVARSAARHAAKDLFAKGLQFRTLFCYWMIRFANPGSGTHCGASFPMCRKPKALLDSDSMGRPFGWSRIFVVDASVLPSIPGTTLALPVMANAYRIASEAEIS